MNKKRRNSHKFKNGYSELFSFMLKLTLYKETRNKTKLAKVAGLPLAMMSWSFLPNGWMWSAKESGLLGG